MCTPVSAASIPKVVTFDNAIVEMRTQLVQAVSQLFFEGKLLECIDQLPVLMRPKDSKPSRCCVYRDRALLKYRILAVLGFDIEKLPADLDAKPLSAYAKEAMEREIKDVHGPIITVISEACQRCTLQQFLVTDACQNCVAQPCKVNCPKDAISHPKNRAHIDTSKCIRCGKCAKVCPYHAIIDIPIPCVNACPVGAITALPDGRKIFDKEKCISCGGCQRACPFGAVMPRSHVIDTLHAIQKGRKVVAMVAPAILGHLPAKVELGHLVTAFKQVGFTDVFEVAHGADVCGIDEAHEFVERMEKGAPFMTTSCCPAYVACAKKHIPDLEQYISHTKSPMVFSSKICRKLLGDDIVTVFIGPCAAKRQEAIDDPNTDLCLTYDEVIGLFNAKKIELEKLTPGAPLGETGMKEGRGFCLTGGLTATILSFGTPVIKASAEEHQKAPMDVKPIVINGLTAQAVKQLAGYAKAGKAPGNVIEVMTCEGGCISGPGMPLHPPVAATKVKLLCNKTPYHAKGTPGTAVPFPVPEK